MSALSFGWFGPWIFLYNSKGFGPSSFLTSFVSFASSFFFSFGAGFSGGGSASSDIRPFV